MTNLERLVKAGLFISISSTCLICQNVAAHELFSAPKYFKVVSVAQNDVLNIRAENSASSQILGNFEPNAQPVEVIREENEWGYVSRGEFSGWVSMKYLQPLDLDLVGSTPIPVGTICAGTEPFWSVVLTKEGAVMHDPNAAEFEQEFEWGETGFFGNRGDYASLLVAHQGVNSIVATTQNRLCSDGMSDADYAREFTMILFSSEGTRTFAGCCQLPLNAQ